MKPIVILWVLLLLGGLSSCKDKNLKQEKLTSQKVEMIEASPVEAEVQQPVEQRQVEKQAKYFIVAGCFEVKANADRLQTELIGKGYDAQIFPFYRMSMVTYNGYETRLEAQAALNRIVSESGGRGAWVYPVK
ncbi:MAG: SPOR domain-containing protein [Odoribacter sp.]